MAPRRNRSADIHAKGRFLGIGPLVAHSDAAGRIRERDGTFYRGVELGYVDRRHRIRRKGSLLQRGEVAGQIRGNSVYGRLAALLGGPRWGYVDQYGNVWQQGSDLRPSRIIGKAKGADPEAALAYFVLKFQDLEDHVHSLEDKVKTSRDRYTFLPRVRAIRRALPTIDALGDVDVMAERLRVLEAQCVAELSDQLLDARRRLRFWNRKNDGQTTLDALRSTWDLSGPERREQFELLLLKARDAIDSIVDGRLPSLSTLDVPAFSHTMQEYEIHEDQAYFDPPQTRGPRTLARSSVERLRAELHRMRHEPAYRLDEFWEQAGKVIGAVLEPAPSLLPPPKEPEASNSSAKTGLRESIRQMAQPRLEQVRDRLRHFRLRSWRL